jgi:hypothetical protein
MEWIPACSRKGSISIDRCISRLGTSWEFSNMKHHNLFSDRGLKHRRRRHPENWGYIYIKQTGISREGTFSWREELQHSWTHVILRSPLHSKNSLNRIQYHFFLFKSIMASSCSMVLLQVRSIYLSISSALNPLLTCEGFPSAKSRTKCLPLLDPQR